MLSRVLQISGSPKVMDIWSSSLCQLVCSFAPPQIRVRSWWPSLVPMVSPCPFSRLPQLALPGEKTQVCRRYQTNGLVLNSPGGLIKGGGLGNVSVIGPSVNIYLANVSSKWPQHSIQDITEILWCSAYGISALDCFFPSTCINYFTMKVVMPRELRREERLGFHRTQPEAVLEPRGSQASYPWTQGETGGLEI